MPVSDPKHLLPKTVSVIEAGLNAGLHIGAQVYVSLRDGTVADLAVGEARRGVPMRTDTSMMWYSAGKPVTAVAIGQLLERGRLELDTRIATLIPEFGNQGKEAITLRHLLTHTGGFRSADDLKPELAWADALAAVCRAPLEPDWVPGQRAGYHTMSSWFVLGEIVRRLDGRPLELYAREEIFLALGLNDSWLGMTPAAFHALGDRLGVMHTTVQRESSPLPFWDTEAGSCPCQPGSNARGPIRDLGRFYEMLLHGGEPHGRRVLQPATVELLTRRHRVGLFDDTFKTVMDWGLGFIVNSVRHGEAVLPYGFGRYAADAAFGHGGWQSSCAFADPARGLVVAWICNGCPGEHRHKLRTHELNSAVYEDLGLV